jgi:hypothetical protein
MIKLQDTNLTGWFGRIYVLPILLVVFMQVDAAGAPSLEDEGWALVFDEQDIQVYRRLFEATDIVETLTLVTFEAAPEQVFAVVTDYTNYPSFMPHIIESRIFEQVGNTQNLFQRISISGWLSFLIKDRYHVVNNRLIYSENGGDHYRVEWSIDADKTRNMKPDDAIATRLNNGFWDIRGSNGGSRSEVRYYLHTDPGGSIPKTAVNAGTTRSIPAVIRAITDRLAAR